MITSVININKVIRITKVLIDEKIVGKKRDKRHGEDKLDIAVIQPS